VLAAAVAASVYAFWPASAATAPTAAITHVSRAVAATATDKVQTSTISVALTPSQYGWLHAVQAFMIRQQLWPGPVRTEVLLSEQLPAPLAKPGPTGPAAVPSTPAAPVAAPTPSGSAQQIALAMLASYGWSASQFTCLQPLWAHESGWNVYASNPGSGAYGIPQALPGSKMARAGPDWQTDAATQIRWGLNYIQATYGSPCAAWAHEQATGWY